MNRLFVSALLLTFVFSFSCKSKKDEKAKNNELQIITFNEENNKKIIEVLANGKPFTTFRWTDNITKPVLYPIFAASGTEITRGFPINPKTGERADHPHQIGMWLTYGNVNGTDFWGNGSKGLGIRNSNGGIIRHDNIVKAEERNGTGILESHETWIDSSGVEILEERSVYQFIARGNIRIIDRSTQLTAIEKDVVFNDTKEGMFAIRVARQLELPLKGNIEVINADGSVSKTADTLNVGITGNYTSSKKIQGEAVWGTRAKWMKLDGKIGDEIISIAICDHPENPGYPTYWHARGYGLFSANPLGVKDFTKGAEVMNFVIPAGKSATFRYRVIISSGTTLTEKVLNEMEIVSESN
jgi:hypothetical protein